MELREVLFWIGLGLLFLLNIVDVILTHMIVKKHGKRAEGNPVARWMWKSIGFWPSASIKVLMGPLVALLIWSYSPISGLATVTNMICIFGIIVWWNLGCVKDCSG